MERKDRVQWVYSSRDNKELEGRYDQWAKDYDADLDKGFGYVGPQRAVDFFTRYVSKEARILDAGAGTGLVGELLVKQGYSNLVAMDMSLGMLEEARAKNAYREFHQMIMGETLGFTTDSFNAVISVGVLTLGHAPASSLDELERVKSSFDLCYLIECSSKYEMKGFTPTTESHGVSRGAPSASRIMIGLHFSSSIKIWGTHPHFSLLLFYSFFVTCESK